MTTTKKGRSMPVSATVAAVGALVALALIAAVAAALPFSGSPIIQYNQRFYIYSPPRNSYCKADQNIGFKCDVALPTTNGATKFFIGGGCGPIPSSDLISATLQIENPIAPFYCAVRSPNIAASTIVWCALADNPGPMFQFCNINTAADGWLHGNATAIQFRASLYGANGWCTAPPATDGTYVQCNRAVVDAWETFYFVSA